LDVTGRSIFASPRFAGTLLALVTFAIDQANKLWLIFVFDIEQRQPVHLAHFLDVVFAKNPGISYSLLSAKTAAGRWGLVAVTLVATAALALWLYRSRTRMTALALGLLIGGALGNAYDRFAYGFVADFYHFHVGAFSWYVFNLADVAIVGGVGLLLCESAFAKRSVLPEKASP
jgi:signal peptidase II